MSFWLEKKLLLNRSTIKSSINTELQKNIVCIFIFVFKTINSKTEANLQIRAIKRQRKGNGNELQSKRELKFALKLTV